MENKKLCAIIIELPNRVHLSGRNNKEIIIEMDDDADSIALENWVREIVEDFNDLCKDNADLLALIRDLADVLEEARTMVNKFSTRSYRNGAEEQREKWLNSKEIIALIARARKVAK